MQKWEDDRCNKEETGEVSARKKNSKGKENEGRQQPAKLRKGETMLQETRID